MPALTHGRSAWPSLVLVTLVWAVVAGGCASDDSVLPPNTTEPDSYLYNLGTEALAEQKWLVAREYFRQIVDGYPQSIHRADAKLGLGDSYLGEGTDQARVMSVSEFREFLAFYPTHPRADYAQHRIAVTHFTQMRGAERDQAPTRSAIQEFNLFIERYQNSDLMPEVLAQLREARDRLSESELRVGLFYYRVRWYPGAIERLRSVLRDDPDFTNRDSVYFYLAEALVKTEKKDEALAYYERLIEEFEQSEHLEDAWARVAEIQAASSP